MFVFCMICVIREEDIICKITKMTSFRCLIKDIITVAIVILKIVNYNKHTVAVKGKCLCVRDYFLQEHELIFAQKFRTD